MDPKTMSNSEIPNTNYMIITTITLLATLFSPALSHNTKFEACAPANCGNGPNISYPFWLSSVQDSFCGYPNFEIICSNDHHPVLTVSEDAYRIKDIFYTNHSVLVANSAAYEQRCPYLDMHNVILERTPFSILPGYVNFSLFYNCATKPISSSYRMYSIDCLTNTTGLSYASLYKEFYQVYDSSFLTSCQEIYDAPVVTPGGTASIESLANMSYTEVLQLGFLFDWSAPNCSTCRLSGGRCGFENQALVCFCHDNTRSVSCDNGKGSNVQLKVIIGVSGLIGSLIFLSILVCLYKIFVRCKFNKENDEDIETFISNYGALAMKRYRFKEIKKMTNSFKDKLGEGGFGSVYKGKLFDGQVVAVKVLKLCKGNGSEFLNEVASISRTSHVNVINMLGYCFESNKRVLIFEFMPNGSLDKFIHDRVSFSDSGMLLGWKKLYEIAVGVARGLDYLHRGCNTRIVHFDIKPHNILLGDDFHPKISDFGLAKLSNARESIMSSMMEARGTIGYIAPEVYNQNFGGVSSKSDVYSYGMLLLDIVGARERDHMKEGNISGSSSSLCYFPNGIYKQVEQEKYDLYGSLTMDEVEIVKRMTLVGLWCIQTIPSTRPAMTQVIEMLEGSVEALKTPPKPFLFSSPSLRVASSTISTTEIG